MNETAIYAGDLFAGCGGLSRGLMRAGLSVRVAVDNDERVEDTFEANHPDTKLILDDICSVRGADLLAEVPGGKLHVLAGCAPCQGFSSLTRKHERVMMVARERDEAGMPLHAVILRVPAWVSTRVPH